MRDIIYILILFILLGCEQQTDWDLEPKKTIDLVVDAILTNERKPQYVTLTKPVYQLNAQPEPATGASLTIFNGYDYYILEESDTAPGKYFVDTSFVPAVGLNYILTIEYNGKLFAARATMEPVTLFKPVTWSEVPGKFNMYRLNNDFESNEVAMWELFLDWSNVTEPYEGDGGKTSARLLYYTLRTADISQLFAPPKADIIFPLATIIIEKKYSLTRDHAEYIRTVLSETEWRGSFFDVSPSNTMTNITENVAGFFSLCTVISDTIIVFPK